MRGCHCRRVRREPRTHHSWCSKSESIQTIGEKKKVEVKEKRRRGIGVASIYIKKYCARIYKGHTIYHCLV